MDWYRVFQWIEATALSTWARESPSLLGFPALLVIHSIGMAFLVGASAAMNLRILGFSPSIPLSALESLLPVMRFGVGVNVISGLLLLIAYPTKNLTNPVFFLKLGLIGIALADTSLILKHVIRQSPPDAAGGVGVRAARILALSSIVLWAGAIVAGRLLAYTYVHLDPFGNPY
jgi:hypothetical protein